MPAGRLDHYVAFDAPAFAPDGQGGQIKGWAVQFTAFAAMAYQRAGEAVLAARLVGQNTVVVRIRASEAARLVTPEYQMRDMRAGTVYNVRSVIPSQDGAWLDITVQAGVVV